MHLLETIVSGQQQQQQQQGNKGGDKGEQRGSHCFVMHMVAVNRINDKVIPLGRHFESEPFCEV